MQIRRFLLRSLLVLSFCINPLSQAYGENTTMMNVLIQNNIKDYVVYMSQQGNYEIKYFGDIVAAYPDVPGVSFNFMFDYMEEMTSYPKLKQALTYTQSKRYPFMLVLPKQEQNPALKDVLAQFKYSHAGGATLMAIEHDGLKFAKVDRSMVKQVTNQQMLDEFCALHDQSFGIPAGTAKAWVAPMSQLFTADFQVKLYLAYQTVDGKDQAVGTAVLYLPQNKQLLAGHYAWTVKDEYRKQGIMTNLAKNMILIAKENGYSASVAQCYDASVRLAAELGFKSYGDLELYANGDGH